MNRRDPTRAAIAGADTPEQRGAHDHPVAEVLERSCRAAGDARGAGSESSTNTPVQANASYSASHDG
jgi:hypothetical protein